MSWPSVSLSRLFKGGHFLERIEKIVMKLIWRTPPFFFYYDRFFIMSYDFDTPAVCNRRLKNVRTRMAGSADIPALNRFLEKGERYANRFRKGDVAIMAELHDEMVGMEWIEAGREHYEDENEFRFPLPEGSAWTYDGYVPPAHQIKGIWSSITDEVVCHLRQNSFHSLYCMIKGMNGHAINSHLRYGYRAKRHVVFIRFLFFRFYLEKNLDRTAINKAWQTAFAFRKLRWYKGSLNT